MYTAKPHQAEALKWLVGKPKTILALDMGLGKTMIACSTIKPGERVLIICPATLKINWKIELAIWQPKIKNIKIIKKKAEVLPKGPGIIIINYDLIGKKVGKRKVEANYDFSDFDRVILDEAHFIKSTKAVRSKIGGRIVKTTPNAVLLSGTIMERPIDLYVPLFSLGALSMPHHTFGMRFCDPRKIYIGPREVWQFRGSSNEEELREIMAPYILKMKKEDVIDLPEKEIKVVALDLPVGRKEKGYNLRDIVKDPRPIGFEGLAELLHEQGLRKLPQAIQHIKMRLESNDKIFVVAKHQDVIDGLMEKLKDFNPVKIDGRVKMEDRQQAVDTFQNDKDCRICVGQIIAAGTGLTLTAANFVVVVEPDWSYSALMQIIDRVHRIGQTKNVTAELLTIHKSICERVLWSTLEKEGYVNKLLN